MKAMNTTQLQALAQPFLPITIEFKRVSVGQNDRVVALFSGIFNDRPTQRKFDFICDVRRVLDFIITLECDRNLSLKQLTLKLTMLLVLTSATRTSEINLLDLRF